MRTAILLALGALVCCIGLDASAVHVRGYTRKDGTYVQPHERRSAGPASSSTRGRSSTHSQAQTSSDPKGSTSGRSAHHEANSHIKRSPSARAAFMREHPCPSTGRTTGACPGYVVDHVRPLKRGGADSPSNMQWQTTEEARRKDRTE